MKIEEEQIRTIIKLFTNFLDADDADKEDKRHDSLAQTAMGSLILRGETDPSEVAKKAYGFAGAMMRYGPVSYCPSCKGLRIDAWVGEKCPDHPEINLVEPPTTPTTPVH